ncbi:MAG: hypothetical protein P8Y25_15100 [Chromatiaceae bacterium]
MERRQQGCNPQQRFGVGRDAGFHQFRQRLGVRLRQVAMGGSAVAPGHLDAEGLGEARGGPGRVGPDSLHGYPVGLSELADHARMRRVEAATEPGAARTDQERDSRRGFTEPAGVPGNAPLGLLALRDGQRAGRIRSDLAALQRRVGHGDEHAQGGIPPGKAVTEGRRRRQILGADATLEGQVEGLEHVAHQAHVATEGQPGPAGDGA